MGALRFDPVNLFTGMSTHEEISLGLAFLLFNVFVVLEASALYAFYVASRPRRGRVSTAALWHIVAALWFLMCLISTVWAAPAEKSFINADDASQPFFSGARFVKVIIGLCFALVGIGCMAMGVLQGRAQRRRGCERARENESPMS